ncbi:MAG: ABC transporter ATP-binding protein [Chloroflexi bacterium]|nr:ABC transporter ATP-binding protein [Chloroflexota bacterium]MCL5110995.1 ABC transporter ATP-binding protein [Chloroflexota bacterium]
MVSRKQALLEVKGLKTHFFTEDGIVPAVDGVDFSVAAGETLGIVGESGCGKSVTALSVMRLIASPGRVVAGSILFEGRDLAQSSQEEMCDLRGNRMAMIFQEPMTSLNPVYTVGEQIREAVQTHDRQISDGAARVRAVEMLRMVGIPLPEERYRAFPHEMSGGMRQRVMIAMALSLAPALLIADEPTTALDVTIQAQILELMKDLRERVQTAVMLITHDLGVVADMADKVAVMYAGEIVENADVYSLFREPLHPYTQGLLASIPTLASTRNQRLNVIHGTVPNLLRLPPGCRFAPRCPKAMDICRQVRPTLRDVDGGRQVSCWLY